MSVMYSFILESLRPIVPSEYTLKIVEYILIASEKTSNDLRTFSSYMHTRPPAGSRPPGPSQAYPLPISSPLACSI